MLGLEVDRFDDRCCHGCPVPVLKCLRHLPLGDGPVGKEHLGRVGEGHDRPAQFPGQERVFEHRFAELRQRGNDGSECAEAKVEAETSSTTAQRMRCNMLTGPRSVASVKRLRPIIMSLLVGVVPGRLPPLPAWYLPLPSFGSSSTLAVAHADVARRGILPLRFARRLVG